MSIESTVSIFYHKHVLLLCSLIVLGAVAFVDFYCIGNMRHTLVFYSEKDGTPTIEDRMIPTAQTKEESLTRYVDEVLLGPVNLDTAPLFSEGTSLESLFYRDGDVYINLSESAVLAPPNGIQDVKKNLLTLVLGLKRNYAYINKVILFIDGNEVIFGEYAAL
jgi:spore germination protein GerM